MKSAVSCDPALARAVAAAHRQKTGGAQRLVGPLEQGVDGIRIALRGTSQIVLASGTTSARLGTGKRKDRNYPAECKGARKEKIEGRLEKKDIVTFSSVTNKLLERAHSRSAQIIINIAMQPLQIESPRS
jgi:hypothetical protein